MEKTFNPYQPIIILIAITVLTSSIVYVEPAPYEVLLFFIMVLALLTKSLNYSMVHLWPVLLLFLFTMTNIFSLFFMENEMIAGRYLIITIYCLVTWLVFVGLFSHFGKDLFSIIFETYVIAALIVAIPGIIGYFTQSDALELYVWNGDRVKGLFKDPNVFGPFLIPPAIYALWQMGNRKVSSVKFIGWNGIFLIMSIGILLSFSRAAWGHFVIAIILYFLLMNDRKTRRLRTLVILLIVFVPVVFFIVTKTEAGDLFFQRTGLQGYDEDRFGQQETSLQYINSYPFGFGPGQSEIFLSQSTHNLFVRILSENGLLGMVFFSLFLVATIIRSIYMTFKANKIYKGYFVIVTISLIGIAFNSLFIDTMHWRHFWLLLAIPWISYTGMTTAKLKESKPIAKIMKLITKEQGEA